MARRAELVKYPSITDINKKILYYLSYLQDKDDKLIQGRSQYEANRGPRLGKILPNVIDFFFIRDFTALGCQWTQKNRPCIKKYITILKAKVSEISDQWASLFHLVFLVFHMILQRIHQNIKGLKIIKKKKLSSISKSQFSISKGFRFFPECRTTLIFTILGPNDHHPRLTVTVFQNKRLHTKFRLKLFMKGY